MTSREKRRPKRSTTNKPLVSVCMIVRDEEEDLARCLRSVRAVSDEVVVVDTGSRDTTVNIARNFGAKVFHFQWNDDFAAARSEAKRHATGSWILQMDADEELAPEGRRCLAKLVKSAPASCWGFYLPVRCYYEQDGKETVATAYRLLLYRNHDDLCYRYRIHENIEYIGGATPPDFAVSDELIIIHHGYMPDHMQKKQKSERNQHLLEQAVSEDPGDAFLQFSLGQHYYTRGQFTEAVGPLQQAVRLCQNTDASYFVSACAMTLIALSRVGREAEVPATIAEAEQRAPVLTADFYCNAGSALHSIGQLEKAAEYFRRAIDTGAMRLAALSDPATHTWRPRLGLGMVYEQLGQPARARTYYEEALAYAPGEPTLHCGLVRTLSKVERPETVLKHVKSALQLGMLSVDECWELLDVCAELVQAEGMTQSTLSELNSVGLILMDAMPVTAQWGAKLSGVCARFREFERGVAAASAALADGKNTLALVNRGACYYAMGRYRDAIADFAAAVACEPDNPVARTNLDAAKEMARRAESNGDEHSAVEFSGRREAPQQSLDDVLRLLEQQQEALESLQTAPARGKLTADDQRTAAGVDSGPLVSIIIPVRDGVERTQRCLEAIIENTHEDRYEVIIVDNGSTDGTKDFLALLDGDVKIVTNEADLGFGASCDQGARVASGQYLIFLNNDAEPRRGWMEALLATTRTESKRESLDGKLVYPQGTAQDMGGVVVRELVAETPRNGKDDHGAPALPAKPARAPSYYDFPRPEVQALVPDSAKRILDVGCATGALGAALKSRQACEVTGIECVPEIAAIARSRLDRVHVGDVAEIAHSLPEAYYDCITMADVLEHLTDPAAVLTALRKSLVPGGRFVLSVPNVRHWSVVRGLLEGRWDYADAGLLDRTHLRFFTRSNFEEMLREVGLQPSLTGTTSFNGTVIPEPILYALGQAGLDVATLKEESAVYQYLYVAEAMKKPATALTSIIVLAHNQLDDTKLCLASLERHTPERHELILVDNGSTDGTLPYLRTYATQHDHVKVIANPENRGFAAGNNQGLAVARGQFIVLLNNDAMVTAGWLDRMQEVVRRYPAVGIVGPMTNYVSGPQLVRGVEYRTIPEMEAFAHRWASERLGKSFPCARVVGFCLMTSKAVIDRIGGLDERYGAGNFEDDDFCVRSTLAGFEARVAEDVFIHHSGGRTFRGAGIDFRESMLRNWAVFKEKWGIAPDTQIEQGYSITLQVGDELRLYVPLPQVEKELVNAT